MARFTNPSIQATGSSDSGTWQILGGTTGTQPTFSSDPLFRGNWTLVGNICTFAIDVDMDNITSFGTGQYFMDLPFPADDNIIFSGGCIHDISGSDQYFILGDTEAGSDRMYLWTVASNGRQVPFEDGVPVGLSTADSFHISGTYQIVPGSAF